MPRMEPTYLAILRAAVAARAVILYPIAALTRQMTVTTYPVPIADLRDVRLVGVFLYYVRRVITLPRADHRRSRSRLGQSRYGLRLAANLLRSTRARWRPSPNGIRLPTKRNGINIIQ